MRVIWKLETVELGRYQFAHEVASLIDTHIRLVGRCEIPSVSLTRRRIALFFFFSNSAQFIAHVTLSRPDDSIIMRFPGTATVSHTSRPTQKVHDSQS